MKIRKRANPESYIPDEELEGFAEEVGDEGIAQEFASEDTAPLEQEYLDSEMSLLSAYRKRNSKAYQEAVERHRKAAIRLRGARRRKKEALDYNNSGTPGNSGFSYDEPMSPEHDETADLYQRVMEKYPDQDPEVVQEAVAKAQEMSTDPYPNEDELEKHVDFFLNRGDEYNTYAYVRNLVRPLACPKCSQKVSRKKENPNRMVCKSGHESQLKLSRLKLSEDAPLFVGGDQEMEAEVETQFANEAMPELGEAERNRFNELIYQAKEGGETPFFMLGMIDGFLGDARYKRMAMGNSESSDYERGEREGRQARSSNTGV